VLATVLAAALFLGGLLAAVDVLLVQAGRTAFLVPTGQWAGWLRAQTFGAGIVRLICGALAVVGLLVLISALRPGRPGALRLPPRAEGITVTARRRELERTLATAATRVDGVSSARAKARRRSVRLHAATTLRQPGDLPTRVHQAVTARLNELGLGGTLRPRITLTRPRSAR
jgi:hypothetical protein